MFKKILSFMLVAILANFVGVAAARAQSQADKQADKQAELLEKLRENVRKLGVGSDARVEVKLQDGSKRKGYIREAGEYDFVVVDQKPGVTTTISISRFLKSKVVTV